MRRSRLHAALGRIALAMLVAVAPLSSTVGPPAAAGGIFADVCTAARGSVQGGAMPRSGDPALPASSHGSHCPLCVASADVPAPPIGDAAGQTVEGAAYRAPRAPPPLSRRAGSHHPAQPRGPPALA